MFVIFSDTRHFLVTQRFSLGYNVCHLWRQETAKSTCVYTVGCQPWEPIKQVFQVVENHDMINRMSPFSMAKNLLRLGYKQSLMIFRY
jgi:hypothetical protein